MGIHIDWTNSGAKDVKIAQEETKRHESDNKKEVQKELANILGKVVDGVFSVIRLMVDISKNGEEK